MGILLALTLLAPSLLVLAPTAAASPADCNAAFDRVEVTPMFADVGDTVAVKVYLKDTNEVNPPDASNRVKLRFLAKYSDGTTELLSGTDERSIGDVFQKSGPIASGAPDGRGTITIEILPPPTDDPLALANFCGAPTPPNSATKNWGFWVGQKPDLHVAATDTAVRLIEHRELLSDNLTHDPFESASLYTRYLPAQGVTCVEETTGDPGKLHFNVTIVNTGAANFRALDSGGELPLVVRVLDGTELIGTQAFTLGLDAGAPGQGVLLDSTFYSLRNKTGIRDLRVQVDVGNVYKESVEDNNEHRSEVLNIMAPDINGTLTDVRNVNGLPTGKFSMTNAGNASAGRVGPQQVCRSRNGEELWARVYLDKVAPEQQLKQLDTGTDLFELGEVVSDDFDGIGFPLSAGRHRVILVVDALPAPAPGGITDNANELSELNNILIEFENLTVEDLRPPVLSGIEVFPATDQRAGSRINISGLVVDDANFTLEGNNVTIEMTFPDATNHTFFVPKTNTPDAGFKVNSTVAGGVDFWFNSTYDQTGLHSFRVRANDTVHEVLSPALAAAPITFSLTEFSKDMQLLSLAVCHENFGNQTNSTLADCVEVAGDSQNPQPVNRTFENGTNVMRVRFKVPAGATGLPFEYNNTALKSVEVRQPDGVVLGNFSVQPLCASQVSQANFVRCLGGEAPDCNGTNLTCYTHVFEAIVGNQTEIRRLDGDPRPPLCLGSESTTAPRLTQPSQWNVTIWVGDSACRFRAHSADNYLHNGSALPQRMRFGLWDTESAVLTGTSGPASLAALSPATFRTDASDNIRVNRSFVLLRRAGAPDMLEDLTYQGSLANRSGTYSKAIPTGIYTTLDLAGDYQWLVGAQDANNTLSWSSANGTTCTPDWAPPNPGGSCNPTPRTFTLTDNRNPTVGEDGAFLVTSAGVDNEAREAFQAGENLTFQAEADDDTRIRVTVDVTTSPGGVLVLSRNLSRVGTTGSLYRMDGNLTTGPGADLIEGEYRFIVRVVDSASPAKTATSLGRVFRVASNLPPSFSLRTPADNGFGAPNGTVSVDISDTLQGVLQASIAVRVGINTPGVAATPVGNLVVLERERRADGVPLVLRASFQLPTTIAHGDTVTVSVNASDGSNPPLATNDTWSFRIDGLAPRSTITCTRSHPAACGSEGPQSVRGDTAFTLTAEDLDPQNRARSGVAAIRYSVSTAAAPGAVQQVDAATATFRLGQFVTQDGFYTLRFRAIDAAGNEEPERSLVFALDSSGPVIENTLVTPTASGWNLTATISDPPSDVRSARVFARAGATAFEERPMERLEQTNFWFGQLPGARRGAQVCYYLEATDFLDNIASNGTAGAPLCFQSENHPPSLTVDAPRDGESVGASLTVRWRVSDLDGDPVSVSLAYRRSSDTQLLPVSLSTEEQGSRTKVLDTGGLVAGTYILRVTASDNQAFNNRTVRDLNITIGGAGTGDGRPTFDKAVFAPGEPIRVRVELDRQGVNVQARLLRDGNVVATEPMEQNPAGSRFYEATFRVSEPGLYTVEVVGEYEDGIPFRITAASPIRVEGGFLGGALDLALMGLLTAAVVALAVVGLRRRGWV